jgi:hypothetical protein
MELFGGLSALATTAVVYLALCGLGETGPWRWICLVTLLGFIYKVIYEAITGQMLFVTEGSNNIMVCTASHISGALIASAFYGWVKFIPARKQHYMIHHQFNAR